MNVDLCSGLFFLGPPFLDLLLMHKPPLGRDGGKQQTERMQGLRQNRGDIQAVPTVPM